MQQNCQSKQLAGALISESVIRIACCNVSSFVMLSRIANFTQARALTYCCCLFSLDAYFDPAPVGNGRNSSS